MADLTYNKFHCFIEDVFEKVHNCGADTFKVALSNTAPSASANGEFVDITEITAGNGYTAGGESLTITSSSQTGGVYSMVITNNVVWTASGGSIGPFQYIVLYNDTATNDELVGYWDIGSAVTLSDGDPYTANLAGQVLISAS